MTKRYNQILEKIRFENGGYDLNDPQGDAAQGRGHEAVLREVSKRLHHSEIGNADRLMLWHGSRIAYAIGAGWLAFDGKIWSRASGRHVVQERMQEVVDGILIESQEMAADKAAGKAAYQHWQKSAKMTAVRAAMAAAEPALLAPLSDFDQAPHLFAVANGVIDLETGELEPHAPEQRLTRMSGVEFDEDATCPAWEQFIDDVTCGDRDLAQFLQDAIGYSLYDTQEAQKAFFLVGAENDQSKNGSNGKSLFLRIIGDVFGDYACTVDRKLIVEEKGASAIPADIAKLSGRRFASGSEFKKVDVLAVDKFKKLTGDEKIEARFLNKDFFDFLNTAKLWYSTNYVPLIPDNDDGAWRRVVLIPFLAKFYEPEDCPPGGIVKDERLASRLQQELPGILNWCVAGAVRYAQNGRHLTVPAALQAAKAEKKVAFDQLGSFLDLCIIKDSGSETLAANLYQAYANFAGQQRDEVISSTAFGRRMTQMSVEVDAKATKRAGRTIRKGARLSAIGVAYLNADWKMVDELAARGDKPFSYKLGDGGVTHLAQGLSGLPDDIRNRVAPDGFLPPIGTSILVKSGINPVHFKRVS